MDDKMCSLRVIEWLLIMWLDEVDEKGRKEGRKAASGNY